MITKRSQCLALAGHLKSNGPTSQAVLYIQKDSNSPNHSPVTCTGPTMANYGLNFFFCLIYYVIRSLLELVLSKWCSARPISFRECPMVSKRKLSFFVIRFSSIHSNDRVYHTCCESTLLTQIWRAPLLKTPSSCRWGHSKRVPNDLEATQFVRRSFGHSVHKSPDTVLRIPKFRMIVIRW